MNKQNDKLEDEKLEYEFERFLIVYNLIEVIEQAVNCEQEKMMQQLAPKVGQNNVR